MHRWTAFYCSALFLPSTLSLAVASILFLWIYIESFPPIFDNCTTVLHNFPLLTYIWNTFYIAMVFQSYALFQHLSVWDNITFGLQLQKLPQERLQELGGRSRVLFGLRPEACTPSFESAMINGKVDFVENTGNLKTATLKLATGESFYLQDSDQGLQMEDIRGFNFDWQNVCLFDAESGENLAKVR